MLTHCFSAHASLRLRVTASERVRQLVVGVVLQLSIQLSGIDVIFYYSTLVLRQATVADPQLATAWLGGLNVVMVLVANGTMEKARRRPVLLASWAGLCVSHALLACSQIGIEVAASDEGTMRVLSLLGMAGVVTCFAFGPGCVAWYVIAEIFPMHARAAAFSLGVALNWAANGLVALLTKALVLAPFIARRGIVAVLASLDGT